MSDRVPLRFGLGGPVIGSCTVTEDERGLRVEGIVPGGPFVPAIFQQALMADIRNLSFRLSEERPPQPLTLRQRLTISLRSRSYIVRERIARMLLPDAPWDDDYW